MYPGADQAGLGTKFLQRKLLFQNVGNKRFRHITDEVGGGLLIERSSRGAAFGDYDNDGDIDVLVINLSDRPTLLRNDTSAATTGSTVRLVGTKSNRDGIGAKVYVAGRRPLADGGSAQRRQLPSHNDMRVHFGLGGDQSRGPHRDPLAERHGRHRRPLCNPIVSTSPAKGKASHRSPRAAEKKRAGPKGRPCTPTTRKAVSRPAYG